MAETDRFDKWGGRAAVEDALRRARSVAGAARLLGASRPWFRECVADDPEMSSIAASVRSEVTGKAAPKDRVEVSGDTARIECSSLADSVELMKSRGFDPGEWSVSTAKVNEWDSPTGETLRQLTIHLRRREPIEWIFPAAEPEPSRKRKPIPKRSKDRPERWIIAGDFQVPYHDRELLDLFLAFVADPEVRATGGVLLGDLLDFPTISRHRDNPPYDASPQECLDEAFAVLASIVEASTFEDGSATRWTKLLGNHDERLRNELLLRAERLFGIRPAEIPGDGPQDDALSIRRLLHLDRLGIDLEAPVGGYANAQVAIGDRLAVRHGWLTGDNTAGKTLDRIGASIIVGHTHAKRDVWKVVYRDIAGERPIVLRGVEIGTMSRIKDGLGYAIRPGWTQGFVTVDLWPDGKFTIDHATFEDGSLLWRDRRFDSPSS
jgi:hypothetical protein